MQRVLASLACLSFVACAGSKRRSEEEFLARGPVTQVDTGATYTCTLHDNGGLKCWGRTIGAAQREPRPYPLGHRVTAISAGVSHACFLLADGHVRCTGKNDWGALGYGHTLYVGDLSDAPNVDIGGTVTQIAAGHATTCAILEGGALRCWGSGQGGRLGYGDNLDRGVDDVPADAGDVNVGGPVTQVSIGPNGHVCAVIEGGRLRCWGQNIQGQLGYGDTQDVGDDETPADKGDVDVGGKVVEVATGGASTCARLDTGAVRCWGFAADGRLGYGNAENIGDNETPNSAGDVPLGAKAVQLAAGTAHYCALVEQGKLRCWGNARSGQLGYGNTDSVGDDETPASVGEVPVGGDVAQVTASGDRTCVLLTTGGVRCWGSNLGDPLWGGPLGYAKSDNIGDDETPASVGDIPLG